MSPTTEDLILSQLENVNTKLDTISKRLEDGAVKMALFEQKLIQFEQKCNDCQEETNARLKTMDEKPLKNINNFLKTVEIIKAVAYMIGLFMAGGIGYLIMQAIGKLK